MSNLKDFARRLWNALPYDHGRCAPCCPTAEDMERSLQAVLREGGAELLVELAGEEFRRWQDEIRRVVIEESGAGPSRIDGHACDSGDPLDLTLAEIRQGFRHVGDKELNHG